MHADAASIYTGARRLGQAGLDDCQFISAEHPGTQGCARDGMAPRSAPATRAAVMKSSRPNPPPSSSKIVSAVHHRDTDQRYVAAALESNAISLLRPRHDFSRTSTDHVPGHDKFIGGAS